MPIQMHFDILLSQVFSMLLLFFRSLISSTNKATMTSQEIYFYRFLVSKQVFYKSRYTYALVNLKPLVPGHVLVVPLRTNVLRFGDLSPEESVDYMHTLQLIHKFIQKVYKADSLNLAIQDGPESGQSVPHLHTHIIPRHKGDGYGDLIHTMLESKDLEREYQEFFQRKSQYQIDQMTKKNEFSKGDEERVARSESVMSEEAVWLARELEKFTV